MFINYLKLLFTGKPRKAEVIRAYPTTEEELKQNGYFRTPTEFIHHNFTAMERYLFLYLYITISIIIDLI